MRAQRHARHAQVRQVEVRRHVEIARALGVGVAEQIGGAVRVLGRHRAEAQRAVDLEGVGIDKARHILELVVRVEVVQAADVQRQALGDLGLVAAVEVDLDIGIAAGILDPLDRRGPGADIKAVGRGVVDAALQRGLEPALRDAAVAVLTEHADVEGQRVGRRGLVGKGRQGDRSQCQDEQRRGQFHVGAPDSSGGNAVREASAASVPGAMPGSGRTKLGRGRPSLCRTHQFGRRTRSFCTSKVRMRVAPCRPSRAWAAARLKRTARSP
mmetsp:Transcript_6592/g.27296  ORF Transcript_6592/g.27296 Transcript_6592/m.27296 type:complete len:269 (+) Transcript_6592:603-1409(+)